MRHSHFVRVVMLFFIFFLGGCVVHTYKKPVPNERTTDTAGLSELDAGPISWHQGDWWRYSDDYALRVQNVVGELGTLVRQDNTSDWVRRKGLFRDGSQSGNILRKVIYRSPNPKNFFPLEDGKSVTFKREYLANKILRVHETSWKVEGRETIEVPAGTFNCWILIWNSKSLTSNWKGVEKWWYSPTVGNFVRMEFKYGDAPPSSRVLMSYKRRG
ncbi:MAG: hypothetical protein HQL69_17015 [Magnetococcales bacterium]|nr:hypothetical protein [Magnetococcales bacterium]